MWTCEACGASSPPHAIFCSACGVMRHKVAPHERPASTPVEPLPEVRPRFLGTVGGFTLQWLGAASGAAFLGWIANTFLAHALTFGWRSGWDSLGRRVSWAVLSALVSGFIYGAFQAMVLRRALDRLGWYGWTWTSIVGALSSALLYTLLPQDLWKSTAFGNRALWTGLAGILGGGVAGLLQARLLARVTGTRGWSGWVGVSAVANLLGNIVGVALFSYTHALIGTGSMGWYSIIGLVQGMGDALVTALLTGIPLAFWLRRRL